MVVLGVYVTSRYKNYPEFKATMDEAIKKYIPTGRPNAFCTGSSKGNSAGNGLVRRYAWEMGVPCRVFETQWADNIPTKPGKKNTAGVRANAMIIRNSTGCIMFWTPTAIAKWDFMSGGCYSFQKMCGKMRRELIPIKVDIYKPIENVDDEEIRTKPDRPEADMAAEAPMHLDGDSTTPSVGGEQTVGDMPIHTSSAGAGGAPHVSAVGGGAITTDGGEDVEGGEMASVENMDGAPVDGIAADVGMPTGSTISEIPVDINGDGTADTSIAAIDTTGDGIPDSQIVPVDTDNNGTIDTVGVAPLPQPVQQTAQQTQQTPTNQMMQTPSTAPTAAPQGTPTAAGTEEENQP